MSQSGERLYIADALRSPYVSNERFERPKEDHKTIVRKLATCTDLVDAARVADLGCANGELLYQVRQRFPGWELHGFDITPEFLACGRSFPGLAGVEFYERDFFQVDGSFDVVLSSCVISVLPDPLVALEKFLSLCSEGGVILVTSLFNPFDIDVQMQFCDNTHDDHHGKWRTDFNRLSQRSVRERFEGRVRSVEFEPCPFDLDLLQDPENPIRVWTVTDAEGNRLLVNGAQQILNQTLLTIRK